MIEELRKNLDTEIQMLREIANYYRRIDFAPESEKRLIETTIRSLSNSMSIINDSIPPLLTGISSATKLPSKNPKTNLENVSFAGVNSKVEITLRKEDRDKLIKELSISDSLIKKLGKNKSKVVEKADEFKAARGYIKFSNQLFLNKSIDLIAKGHFKALSLELKKANIDILTEAYISMMFLTTLIAFGVSLLITILLLFSAGAGQIVTQLSRVFWIPIVIPIVVYFAIYYYPSTEKSSISKRIEQELPFAVIHMSAISGSGIEPTEIFKIIGLSKEYPFLRKEVRKVLNQINLYGYDLVTALNNSGKNTPSAKLSELFAGLSTTISSGGSLTEFFNKRAETLLLDYRLEREKYTRTAETFMDIYISVVIAAPMILMLLLIMISVSGFPIGFSPGQITFGIIIVIALINILFLGLLQAKQPVY